MNSTNKQSLFQILSLDVILGSLAVGLFAVRLLNVNPNPWWWLILPSAVWVVYTLDHLVDGFKRKGESSIYRHRFHYQNRELLIILIAVLGIVVTVLSILLLDYKIIVGGVILGFIVILYQGLNFVSRKSTIFFFQKELIIAVVYISGIFLAPVVWYGNYLTGEKLSIMILLIGLAFAESVIISWFDFEEDTKDNLTSFTINFGKERTRKVMRSMLAGTFFLLILCAWFFQKQFLPFLIILSVMDVILFVLMWKPELFEKNHLFRWIGESVFYLPALVFFFSP